MYVYEDDPAVNSEHLWLLVAFVRTSALPVSEAGGGVGPAEFPGNILEAHGEGRVPGRINPDASENSPSGKTGFCLSLAVIMVPVVQGRIHDLPRGGGPRRVRGARVCNGSLETEPLVGIRGQSPLNLKAFRLFLCKRGPKVKYLNKFCCSCAFFKTVSRIDHIRVRGRLFCVAQ